MMKIDEMVRISNEVSKKFPKGAKVELVEMNDPYRQIPKGTRGTVVAVDSMATIHVKWDNGSCLGVAYPEDKVRKISEEEISLYFYNGFSKPQKIDVEDFRLSNNYLGDITDEFKEFYEETMENYTIEELEKNQPFAMYDIWVNPTIKELQRQNTNVYGLGKNDYLEDFASSN